MAKKSGPNDELAMKKIRSKINEGIGFYRKDISRIFKEIQHYEFSLENSTKLLLLLL